MLWSHYRDRCVYPHYCLFCPVYLKFYLYVEVLLLPGRKLRCEEQEICPCPHDKRKVAPKRTITLQCRNVLPSDVLILTKCYHNEAAYLTHGGFFIAVLCMCKVKSDSISNRVFPPFLK